MQHHFRPETVVRLLLHTNDRHPQSSPHGVLNQPDAGGVFQTFRKTVAAAPGRTLHDIGLPVGALAGFDVINGGAETEQPDQPLNLGSQLPLVGLRHGGGPAVGSGGVGIFCLGIKALGVEGDELQFPIHGKTIRIGGKAFLSDKILYDEFLPTGIGKGVFYGSPKLRRIIHSADAFASGGIRGFYNNRPAEDRRIAERRFD